MTLTTRSKAASHTQGEHVVLTVKGAPHPAPETIINQRPLKCPEACLSFVLHDPDTFPFFAADAAHCAHPPIRLTLLSHLHREEIHDVNGEGAVAKQKRIERRREA